MLCYLLVNSVWNSMRSLRKCANQREQKKWTCIQKSGKEKKKKKKHLCKFIVEIKFYVQVHAKYFIQESNDTYLIRVNRTEPKVFMRKVYGSMAHAHGQKQSPYMRCDASVYGHFEIALKIDSTCWLRWFARIDALLMLLCVMNGHFTSDHMQKQIWKNERSRIGKHLFAFKSLGVRVHFSCHSVCLWICSYNDGKKYRAQAIGLVLAIICVCLTQAILNSQTIWVN